MYDIDMDTAATQIADLRREVSGVQVVCYISVGTWESQRQVSTFPPLIGQWYTVP